MKTDKNYSPTRVFYTYPRKSNALAGRAGALYYDLRACLSIRLWLGLTDVYNLFHSNELESDLKKHFATRAKKDPQGLAIPDEHRAAPLNFTYDEALAGILELRRLHVELDNAVLAAYGWNVPGEDGPPITLAHDFYEVETLPENDRVRYTISPAARKELLKRLLALNHERAKAEAATSPKKGKKRKATDAADEAPSGLFAGEA